MLSPTYTSVKNANLVDCGKKQHISSQPSSLLKDNFLGEFRTELEKKKVLANLGIATELSLEWQYIKGDIGSNTVLMAELDRRGNILNQALIDATTYTVDGVTKEVKDIVQQLEAIITSDEAAEAAQNAHIESLQTSVSTINESLDTLSENLGTLRTYVNEEIKGSLDGIANQVKDLQSAVDSINSLIKISNEDGNALLTNEDGLYVQNLQPQIDDVISDVAALQSQVTNIDGSLDQFVKRDELGGGDLDFVQTSEYESFVQNIDASIIRIQNDLSSKVDSSQVSNSFAQVESILEKTVKTGEDGHVDTFLVNKISKNNNSGNIKLTDSFEMEYGIPLDIRFVVNNTDDLLALDPKVCYVGMPVVVANLSSIYILRKPANGDIDASYIQDINNWKCPEDLVTQVIKSDEYNALKSQNALNDHVFYYIIEEEVTRTDMPKETDFSSPEEYQAALEDWRRSLMILSDQYMSADWGTQIEKALRGKATRNEIQVLSGNIDILQTQIDSINGGSSTSLSSLSQRIAKNEQDLNYLLGTTDTEGETSDTGKIHEIETSISDLSNTVSDEYVSIASIADDSGYIFVSKSDHASDIENLENSIKEFDEEINTKKVTTDLVILDNTNLAVDQGVFKVGDNQVAYENDVPKIEILTEQEYQDLVQADKTEKDVYYYTLCEEDGTSEFYVTNELLNSRIQQLSAQIQVLSNKIQELEQKLPNQNQE